MLKLDLRAAARLSPVWGLEVKLQVLTGLMSGAGEKTPPPIPMRFVKARIPLQAFCWKKTKDKENKGDTP